MRHGMLAKLGLLGWLVAGCGLLSPAPVVHVGRTTCGGPVIDVSGTMPAAGEQAVEELQTTYQDEAGFLAVVWNLKEPVVVVDRLGFDAWQARLAPKGIAVAPSCIDVSLLGLVMRALPLLADQGVRSAGYNAVDDAIAVGGVDAEALLKTIDTLEPGTSIRARAAMADGTLRVSAGDAGGGRQ